MSTPDEGIAYERFGAHDVLPVPFKDNQRLPDPVFDIEQHGSELLCRFMRRLEEQDWPCDGKALFNALLARERDTQPINEQVEDYFTEHGGPAPTDPDCGWTDEDVTDQFDLRSMYL